MPCAGGALMAAIASSNVPASGRIADVAIGALATLIYLGEYLGQGAIANKGFNTGSVTALATAAFGTLLSLLFSERRNPLSGPRFLSIVFYTSILDYTLALPALKTGGAVLAFAVTSLSLSASGLWLILVYRFGLEGRLRALMSQPALSALGFIVATTTIAGQLTALNSCSTTLAWPALTVAATVVCIAFAMKYTLRQGSLLYRARLCVALVCGGLVYFIWRANAPTPTLCEAVSLIQGGSQLDALMGAWHWPAQTMSALAHTEVLLTMLAGSFVLALLCLIDTVSAASSLASDEGRPDANTSRELLSTGVGNLIGGFLGLLPISLSLSRSRTVAELKPTSGRLPAFSHASVILLLIILLVPLQLPLLNYLPKAAIAGALIVVSIEMIDEKSILLWRAGLGAHQARTTLAGGVWVFVLALTVAVLFAIGPLSKLAISAGFAAAIAGSLIGLMVCKAQAMPVETPLGGHLNFLNIGRRMRLWKQARADRIDLSETTHIDFSAACALVDLARGMHSDGDKETVSPFDFSLATDPQVPQLLEICYPCAFAPAKSLPH